MGAALPLLAGAAAAREVPVRRVGEGDGIADGVGADGVGGDAVAGAVAGAADVEVVRRRGIVPDDLVYDMPPPSPPPPPGGGQSRCS